MIITDEDKQIQFFDPRLFMTTGGRSFVRIVGNVTYGILLAMIIGFFIADVLWLRSLGMLFVLFLLDRFLHRGQPKQFFDREEEITSLNVVDYITPATYRMIEIAFERSSIMGGSFSLHLMKLLGERRDIKTGLIRLGVPYEAFLEKIKNSLRAENIPLDKQEILTLINDIGVAAYKDARKNGDNFVQTKHIFTALIAIKIPEIIALMKLYHVKPLDLENAFIFHSLQKRRFRFQMEAINPRKVKHRVMNRAWSAKPTPFLDTLGEDLTDFARITKRAMFIGHEQEYNHVVDILLRPQNANALLVGDPGIGTEIVINRLAWNIVYDRVPQKLFDRRLVAVHISKLLSGSRGEDITERIAHEGDVAERITRLVDEVTSSGNIILYFPDVHNIAKGSSRSMNIGDLLLPALRDANVMVIGATYPREFKEYIEMDTEFAHLFERVNVKELNEPESVQYLVYKSLNLEKQYDITITFQAIQEAVSLAHRYLHRELLPGSAKKLLEEAFALAKKQKKSAVTHDDVLLIAEEHAQIPIHIAKKTEAKKLLQLETLIHERYINQEEAVRSVSEAVREYRSGLTREGGPIASFLFVGPTGVGKTELSKLLTELQFGDEKFMLRFDMSEYQEAESLHRFIGSPDGKIRGALTDGVLEKPYSLILLDEFEKANPNILNLFLQVFDEGRLTDAFGRTVEFENTIIIATSNAHSEFIKKTMDTGAEMAVIEERLKWKLTDFFKPELLNRFSRIVVFQELSQKHVWKVTELQLAQFAKDIKERNSIELTFDDKVIDEIAKKGYDPGFGARPIQRVINDNVRSLLAKKILNEEITEGMSVHIGYKEGEFVIRL
jgi:ATP-dependent Clp protease ATP-binding subunit ClpC